MKYLNNLSILIILPLLVNKEFKDIIILKNNLNNEQVYKIYITGDGNCFFRCVSDFLYQTEEKYNLKRMAIFKYDITYINEITDFQPDVKINPNAYIDTRIYINNMGTYK